ncbi:MAG: hypothetical protein LBJ78_03640 [Puniceicoccales bacterium]|jgi:hypothetical protein|nr:hypothetical protein [Puniceicoccales bacterium]
MDSQNKTEAQKSEELQKLYHAIEEFLTAARDLSVIRADYESKSGLGKGLHKRKYEQNVIRAQNKMNQSIQNYKFSPGSPHDVQMAKIWLDTTLTASDADKELLYPQIMNKLAEYPQSTIFHVLKEHKNATERLGTLNPNFSKFCAAYEKSLTFSPITLQQRSIPNTSSESQEVISQTLTEISQCLPNSQPLLLHTLYNQFKKSVDQSYPASEANKLLLRQLGFGLEAVDSKNEINTLIRAEKRFQSTLIDYLTNQLNSSIDSQQVKQLHELANICSKMADLMLKTAAPQQPYANPGEALFNVSLKFNQHIARLPLLIKEIPKAIERSDTNRLQHTLQEFKTVTATWGPMLALVQARVESMTLTELNNETGDFLSACALKSDEKYGITPELRRLAGAQD